MNRFPWYLMLLSTNHASSNPGQSAKKLVKNETSEVAFHPSPKIHDTLVDWIAPLPTSMDQGNSKLCKKG